MTEQAQTAINESDVDYRHSHVAPGYGESYHRHFSETPYRAYIWGIEQNILHSILKRYFGGRARRYLDFACGTGRILALIEGDTDEAVGVDISPSMLEVAKTTVCFADLVAGDLTRDPILGDDQFDLITTFRFFLNAQPELRADAMAALARHLAPTGYLVFNIHNNRSGLRNNLSKLYTMVRYRKITERNEMSRAEVRALVESCGLELVETIPYGTFPNFRESRPISLRLARIVDRLLPSKILSTFIVYVARRSPDSRPV